MKNESISTKKIVMTAFFAAIIYLGIQSFRIPLPAAVGTPFLHFGHIFVMLAVLMLGPKLSTVAGVLGLLVFDVLNGYIQAIPNVFVSTIIKCLLVGMIFQALKKKAQGDAKKEYGYAVLCAAIYGITNIIVDFIWSTVELVVLGSSWSAALAAEITSIPATIINAGFTVVGIAILYVPVKKAYKRILGAEESGFRLFVPGTYRGSFKVICARRLLRRFHKLDIIKIQKLLREAKMDGWLFTDFQGHDFITKEFLKLENRFCTRRLFYLIPAQGEPVKVLSAIEPLLLEHLPGKKILYQGIEGQKKVLSELLKPGMKIACQYSPGGNVPTISSMDAGLIEYLRTYGIKPVTSADLMQHFGAVLSEHQIETHRQAGVIIHKILTDTFSWIREKIDAGTYIDEYAMLQKMQELIRQENIYMDSPPFFGIDEHTCDPGYEPNENDSKQIREGSRLIIDIAGRLPEEDAVYYDVSWCMNVGEKIEPEYKKWFQIVYDAREDARQFIQARLDEGETVRGYEVDRRLKERFEQLGCAQYLMHRTGHNIGHRCHGIGANLDDYETHDDRCLLPGTMFSIEPGLYTEKYGVRLEYDVHITSERETKVYGPVQDEILVI